MCWTPTNKLHKAIAKIAKKDIPIIKVGISTRSDSFVSVSMHAQYQLNSTVPRIKICPVEGSWIARGYHFFKPNMVVIYNIPSFQCTIPCIGIRGKFAQRFSCPSHFCEKNLVIAKGFIPKGTVYYLNANGEGVAERICLTEMTKL